MEEESRPPLVQVEHLKKYYPIKGGIVTHTTGNIHAVDDISFSIREGETLGLVGESGCGKSTTGRQLVCLEKPTDGKIYYDGRDLSSLDKREMRQIRTQLQMVFQDPYSSLNPRKHIYEILSQPMLYHHISTKESVERDIGRILDMVGLPKQVLGRYPHEFSGGQRQRIGIAKALSLNPRFIVCDEPVSALDVSIQAQILNLLKGLQKELRLTLLFVGHGLGAVDYVSDRIAVMYLGKIVEIGEAREIFRHPVHPYTRALLAAVPVPDPAEKSREHNFLPGEIGDSAKPPSGCRFHPRCPYARPQCAKEEPALLAVKGQRAAEHFAACPVVLRDSGSPAAVKKVVCDADGDTARGCGAAAKSAGGDTAKGCGAAAKSAGGVPARGCGAAAKSAVYDPARCCNTVAKGMTGSAAGTDEEGSHV